MFKHRTLLSIKMNKQLQIILLALLSLGVNAQENEYYEVRKLTSNSKYSDFGISFMSGNEVTFASARDFSGNDEELDENGNPFLSMYTATITDENDLTNITPIRKWIDLNYHQSNAAFTKDGKTVYFTASNVVNGRLKKSRKNKNLIQMYRADVTDTGDWINIEKLPFNSDEYQTGHPTLNGDDSILFFVSDRPESTGRTDIFSVYINDDGTFSEPKNLGPNINTNRREMFPFFDSKTNQLYFSSDGQEHSLGGLDIYMVDMNADEVINSEPFHFKGPINTYWDDFSYVSLPGKKEGYLSSNRYDVKDDNIYYFKQVSSKDCEISGNVSAGGLGTSLENTAVTLYDGANNLVGNVVTDKLGDYTFTLPCDKVQGQTFTVKAVKDGYGELFKQIIGGSDGVDGVDGSNLLLLSKDFVTSPSGGILLDISPIYFDYGSSRIKERSVIDMEKVVNLLEKYPSLKIRIESHTDSRSSTGFNQRLSDSRAASTRDWLIDRGVDPSRLTSVGYGETKLLNKCSNGVPCTQLEHLVNRRTDFVIVNE